MKKIFLVFCILFTCEGFAQSNGKLAVSFFVSPDWSYRTLQGIDPLSQAVSEVKNNYENAMLTYTSGMMVSRKLFGVMAFETGLNYNKRGFVFDSSSIFGNYSLSTTYIYNYLQVPVRLKLFIPSGKWNFYITGGVSGMMLLDALKNSVETKNGIPSVAQDKLKNEALKQFNYNMLFGVGLDYQLLKRLFLKVEPTFSKTLESIRKDNLQTYLYSTGLNVGFLVVLKKGNSKF